METLDLSSVNTQELIGELKDRQVDLAHQCSTQELKDSLVKREDVDSIDVRRLSSIGISIENKGFDTYDSGDHGCTIVIVKEDP